MDKNGTRKKKKKKEIKCKIAGAALKLKCSLGNLRKIGTRGNKLFCSQKKNVKYIQSLQEKQN